MKSRNVLYTKVKQTQRLLENQNEEVHVDQIKSKNSAKLRKSKGFCSKTRLHMLNFKFKNEFFVSQNMYFN